MIDSKSIGIPQPTDPGENLLSIPSGQIGAVIAEIMRPVIAGMVQMLENNTAALEQLSAAQSIQNDRLEALEKQIRLQTPVTGRQASYLNDAMRKRARELLDKHGIDDPATIKKLSSSIRRAVLSRYGIGSTREIPRHEYPVAMSQISMFNDALVIRDLIREARRDQDTL